MFLNERAGQVSGWCDEVGVAPDAPSAVGSSAEDSEDVSRVFAGFASFDWREGDLEEVPANSKVAVDGDLLHVGAAFDGDHFNGGSKLSDEFFPAHGRTVRSEKDDVVGQEVE